jgi:hypothetical protein
MNSIHLQLPENLPIDRPITPVERIELNITETERNVVYWRNRLESLHREKEKLETKEKENR